MFVKPTSAFAGPPSARRIDFGRAWYARWVNESPSMTRSGLLGTLGDTKRSIALRCLQNRQQLVDGTSSPTPGRELAAPGRDGRAAAMLGASVPLSRREAHARTPGRVAGWRPGGSGPDAPDRASGRARTGHRPSKVSSRWARAS